MKSHKNKIDKSPLSYLQNQNGRGIALKVLSFLSNTDLKNLRLTSKDDYQFANIEFERRKQEMNKQFLNPNDALNHIYNSSFEETMSVITSYQSTESFKRLEEKYNDLSLKELKELSKELQVLSFDDVDQIFNENTIKLNHSSTEELAAINTDLFNVTYKGKITPIEIICLTLSMNKVCQKMHPRILIDALISFEPFLQYLKDFSNEKINFFYFNLIITLKACIYMKIDIPERNSPFLIMNILSPLSVRANNWSDSYLNLSGIYLYQVGSASLRNINFSHSKLLQWCGSFDLSFSNFSRSRVGNVFMQDSILQNTDFSDALFVGESHSSSIDSSGLIGTKFNRTTGILRLLDPIYKTNFDNTNFDRINFVGLEAKIEFSPSSKKTLFDNCIFLPEQLLHPNDFKKTLDQLANRFKSLKGAQEKSFSNGLAKNILGCLRNRNTETEDSIELTLKFLQIAIDHKIFNSNLIKKIKTKGKKMLIGFFDKKSSLNEEKLLKLYESLNGSLNGEELLKLYKEELKNSLKVMQLN